MAKIRADVAMAAEELQELVAKLQRRLRAEVSISGITLAEATSLSRLDRGGPATTTELATGAHVRPQSIAATLASLESKGYVRRSDDKLDRRKILFTVTPSGLRLLQNMRRTRQDWLAKTMTTHMRRALREVQSGDIMRATPSRPSRQCATRPEK